MTDDSSPTAINCLPGTSNSMNISPPPNATLIKTRGRNEIMTKKLASALDRCKVSDRDAVHILISVAESLGNDVRDLVINRSSIKRYREQARLSLNNDIRKAFLVSDLNAVVLHWDGKLLPDLTGKQTVDRLPIVITNNGSEQLLGVPKLLQGTAKAQADAVYQHLVEWGLIDQVKAMCFDTTASNTG